MINVSCNILVGFLGSGKTTLLRYIMQHGLQNRRVAIIMNEIGDIGIDGKVITGLEGVESIVELNSGCVCCTIEDYRFAIAVQQIIQEVRPDLLIIQTTGLRPPVPSSIGSKWPVWPAMRSARQSMRRRFCSSPPSMRSWRSRSGPPTSSCSTKSIW